MHERAKLRTCCAVLLLALCTLAAEESKKEGQTPRDIGLVERAGRGLVQLDVTVRGPQDAIHDLTARDFRLVVGGKTVEHLVVDRLCPDPAARPAEAVAAASTTEGPSPQPPLLRPRTSFLFYFDQRELTLAGRQNAIDLARSMVPQLVRDGNRGAIVSNGKKLDTLADLTDDPQKLLAALNELEGDREQWVLYPQEEESRIREVLERLQEDSITFACSTARRFYIEESRHTDKSLRLFAMTLGHLAGLDPPKVVFYFADTMRRNAGEHYLSYVGRCSAAGEESAVTPGGGGFGAQFAMDNVVEQAAAQGTRVYTIRAEGLVAAADTSRREGYGPSATTNMQRYSQAGDSLASLALETGGRSFINGELGPKIVDAVEDDLGCMYLVSFERPADLPEDQLLRVLLTSDRPKVKVFTRGQLVLQSESARRTSRLLSAFAAPASIETDVPLHGALVPTGFEHGRYTALLQVQASGLPIPDTTWDIGASLLTAGEVKGDVSTRVRVDAPNTPLIFEAQMSFRPGPYEVVLVANEASSNQLGTHRIEGAWPLRDDGPAITPIALLQPADALFVRDGKTRASGPLVLGESDRLRVDRATAFVGMVCRGPAKSGHYRLERVLLGEAETRFQDLELDLGDEPCVQFRDVIEGDTLTAGGFAYRVLLVEGDRQVASAERTFDAGETPAATAGPAP